MPKIYHESNIVLIPTFSDEGTSLSALEAMASGRAVVMTNIGGLLDIGEDKKTKLSSNCNSREIAKNLLKLINDNDLRNKIAKKGLEDVKKTHNINDWSDKWQKILTEISKKN